MKVEPGHIAGADTARSESEKLGASLFATSQVSFAGTISLLTAAPDSLGWDSVSCVEGLAPAAAAHVWEDVNGAAVLAAEWARLGDVGRVPQGGDEADGSADGGAAWSSTHRRSSMQAAGVGGEERGTALS